ncbi:hypothetical protein [Sphingobium xenophagum]|uniref:hypothetical protein n=1 Tax=Sphingobium xenophagum TaxID=121428 RepID=UPI00286AAF90|nr:hypothetical protein [Sphingobium xenophagum]
MIDFRHQSNLMEAHCLFAIIKCASCLVATHHWDMVNNAIADHAWRFAALVDEVS